MAEQIARLVKQAQEGELLAYESLVRRFQDAVYGAALARLGDWHNAEDAAQDVFLQAWRKLGDLREPRKFPGWLRRITVSCCARLRRRPSPRGDPKCLEDVPSDEAGPPEQMERRELGDRVLDALKGLSEPLRETTTLFYIDGYSHDDVARFLDVPMGTVKRRLHDARSQLKEEMMAFAENELRRHKPSDQFADMIIRLATSQSDLRVAARYLTSSARHHKDLFERPGTATDARVVVREHDGELESAAWYCRTRMSIGNTVVRCIRVGEVADECGTVGSPQFIAGTLAAFEYARGEGEYLAVAHGDHYNHPRCRYVPSFYHPLATLDVAQARELHAEENVRKLRKTEREDAQSALLSDPSATKLGGWLLRPNHVVTRNDAVVGYFGYEETDGRWAPKTWCSGITLKTRAAARAVFRFLAERAQKAGEDHIYVFEAPWTVAGRTVMELGGTTCVRGTWHEVGEDEEHVAILSLSALTRALRKGLCARLAAAGGPSGSFSLQMEDEVVSFAVAGGKITLGTRKHRTHLELPRWVVTRMYVGYYGAGEALQRAGARVPARVERLLKALFPPLWPCSIPDFNFWLPGRQRRDHPPSKRQEIERICWPWLE